METTVNQRVLEVMRVKNFNPKTDRARFAKAIGLIRPDNLYNLLSGTTKKGSNVLELITKTFEDINPEWLHYGKGTMLKQSVGSGASSSTTPAKDYETLRLKWEATRDENISLLKDKIAAGVKVKELESKVEFLEDELKKLRQILSDNNIAI
jgi:hypothetical protein